MGIRITQARSETAVKIIVHVKLPAIVISDFGCPLAGAVPRYAEFEMYRPCRKIERVILQIVS